MRFYGPLTLFGTLHLLGCSGGQASSAPDGGQASGVVSVVSAELRACDFLFKVSPVEVHQIAFDPATKGAHFRRGDKLAVSVISNDDVPFPPNFVRIDLESGGSISLTKASCFDRNGRAYAGDPGVSFR
jgi:hypothetical protein